MREWQKNRRKRLEYEEKVRELEMVEKKIAMLKKELNKE